MCSHMSAFRAAANIRKELMRHITALPLGVTEKYGSGKLRRIVNTSSNATETYLAHRLPDKAGAIPTPIGPVSYTHLDVYKRQAQHWILQKFSGILPTPFTQGRKK